MITAEFEFVLPIAGKKVKWRPLSWQESMDIAAGHANASAAVADSAAVARRIIAVDDQQGFPPGLWSQISEDDFIALREEIETKEAMRRIGFRKQREGGNAFEAVRHAIEESQLAANNLGRALKLLMEANAAYEASKPPFPSSGST